MVRMILILGLVILLTGCFATTTIKVKTEVQETLVPVLYCPAPPQIERPILPIHTLTEEDLRKDGMVAKSYKATVKALMGYAKEQEAALAEFGKINKKYEEERKNVENGIKERKTEKETGE